MPRPTTPNTSPRKSATYWLTLLCTAGHETRLVCFGADAPYVERLSVLLEHRRDLACGHTPCARRVMCTVEVGQAYRVAPGEDA